MNWNSTEFVWLEWCRYGTLGDAGLDDPHPGLVVRTFLSVAHQQDG